MRLPIGGAIVALLACSSGIPEPPPGSLVGTWGGDDAGLIVTESGAHAHIGCTKGDFEPPILLDGRFDVQGAYNITAYPVDRGILHPARFVGSVDGARLTLTVTLTDTAVTLGPVTLTFAREPEMSMCPICRAP